MLVIEAKLYGNKPQYTKLDEMIRTASFVRNSCIRYWMDNEKVGQYDLSRLCKELASEFEWAKKLNSMARQASAERAWASIKRFYDTCSERSRTDCKNPSVKKKGFPKFKKGRSVEYKTSGWELSKDRTAINFRDGFKAGWFKMRGGFDLNFYQLNQIKRVRVIRRADGYYVQFCIDQERFENIEPSGNSIGLDVGLTHFYTDSNGQKIDNPRHLRKSEKQLKRLQRQVSKKKKDSNSRQKAIKKLDRKHLKVSRQRKDWLVKLARCVVQSNDLVAYEKLSVKNMVKNHPPAFGTPLTKGGRGDDASWRTFFDWLEYYGKVMGKIVYGVNPQYTSQECLNCKAIVKKTLSQRTHICECGCVMARDEVEAINILAKALRELSRGGQSQTSSLELLNANGHINLCQRCTERQSKC
jgi:putative transposase